MVVTIVINNDPMKISFFTALIERHEGCLVIYQQAQLDF
jgi:hypothetical protein